MCTTELAEVANLIPEFTKRDVKVIALSCDTVTAHKGWITDIKVNRTLGGFVCIDTLCSHPTPPTLRAVMIQSYACYARSGWPYPLIADPNRDIAIQLGMLDPTAKDKSGIPVTCRAVSGWLVSTHTFPMYILI